MKKQQFLSKETMARFAVQVLEEINQNNFLTIGPAQKYEVIKLEKIVDDFFRNNYLTPSHKE